MTSNHDERAIHAGRDYRDSSPAETRRAEQPTTPAPAGDRSRSRTITAWHPETVRRLERIADRLRRWQDVPDEAVRDLVTGRGACMLPAPADGEQWPHPVDDDPDPLADGRDPGGDGPPWWDAGPPPEVVDARTDREIAARLCAGCPVIDACTEWELRLHGGDTVGVWGAMSEQDRRSLYPLWHNNRQNGDQRTGNEYSDDECADGASGGDR